MPNGAAPALLKLTRLLLVASEDKQGQTGSVHDAITGLHETW